jgi:uncharacterized protein (DUF2132 family)
VSDADGGPPPAAPDQPRNPLHGVTLEQIVTELAADLGWPALGRRVPVRCFTHDPSVASSLKFLRRTPWARAQVEALYVATARDRARRRGAAGRGGAAGA